MFRIKYLHLLQSNAHSLQGRGGAQTKAFGFDVLAEDLGLAGGIERGAFEGLAGGAGTGLEFETLEAEEKAGKAGFGGGGGTFEVVEFNQPAFGGRVVVFEQQTVERGGFVVVGQVAALEVQLARNAAGEQVGTDALTQAGEQRGIEQDEAQQFALPRCAHCGN